MIMNKRKKGFTLAELLVVVSIIAVLVAIAIPIFTNQLEKARQARDLANIRSAYAEVMVAATSEEKELLTDRSVQGMYRLKTNENIWTTTDYSEYDMIVELKSDPAKWNENKAYEAIADLFTYNSSELDPVLSFTRKDGDMYAVVGFVQTNGTTSVALVYTANNIFE